MEVRTEEISWSGPLGTGTSWVAMDLDRDGSWELTSEPLEFQEVVHDDLRKRMRRGISFVGVLSENESERDVPRVHLHAVGWLRPSLRQGPALQGPTTQRRIKS